MIDVEEYEDLARDSGAYGDIELEILTEPLSASKRSPGDPFTMVEIRDGKILAGFAIYSKAANTESSYECIAFCVDRDYRDKGIGANLLDLLETEILKAEKSPILRFEISTKKAEAMGGNLLPDSGYSLIGHIPDFYEKGDDYFIYARHLEAQNPAMEPDGQTADPAEQTAGPSADKPDEKPSGDEAL